MKLLNLKKPDDLKPILSAQKIISLVAEEEMVNAANKHSCDPEGYIEEVKNILEKYAKYPSLSEFSCQPILTASHKWGATFGVGVLMEGFILKEIVTLYPQSPPLANLRNVLFIVLNNIRGAYILRDEDPLIAVILGVCEQFGLIYKDKITPMGTRILIHLRDLHQVLREMKSVID